MGISLSFHIIGLVFWLGGLIFITRFLALLSKELHAPSAEALKKLYWGFVIPGLAIATLSGLYQLISRGLDYYFRQTHWFHSKLTLVIILFIVTGLVGNEITKAVSGKPPSRVKAGAFHGITSALLILIVFITLISTR